MFGAEQQSQVGWARPNTYANADFDNNVLLCVLPSAGCSSFVYVFVRVHGGPHQLCRVVSSHWLPDKSWSQTLCSTEAPWADGLAYGGGKALQDQPGSIATRLCLRVCLEENVYLLWLFFKMCVCGGGNIAVLSSHTHFLHRLVCRCTQQLWIPFRIAASLTIVPQYYYYYQKLVDILRESQRRVSVSLRKPPTTMKKTKMSNYFYLILTHPLLAVSGNYALRHK